MSVIVTVVDGGDILERNIAALLAQSDQANVEILVPYDHICRDVGSLAERFQDVKFVDIGMPFDGMTPSNPLEEHRFYDRRRAAGLELATAPLIAMVEDCGIPEDNWVSTMLLLHKENQEGVIGGAVVQGTDTPRHWANYFCDFSRYHPPLNDREAEYVTSTNICYKRDAIMDVAHMWRGGLYQEVLVNWELRNRGWGTLLDSRAVTVSYREIASVSQACHEFYHWGRMFGQQRTGSLSGLQKAKFVVASPVLPFLLFGRRFAAQLKKKQNIGKFLVAAPFTFLYLASWSYGELTGYLTARSGVGEEVSLKS